MKIFLLIIFSLLIPFVIVKVKSQIQLTQPMISGLNKKDWDSMTRDFESKSSWLHFMTCNEETEEGTEEALGVGREEGE